MRFNYQARIKTGEVQTGVVEASNRDAAFTVLKAHGLFVTSLEVIVVPLYAKNLKIFERITAKDIMIFSRQVAIMFKSKVPLTEIFHTIAQQTRNPNFKETIVNISAEVEGGTSLSSALAMYPKLFSQFYINMVKSGEASGKITDIFLYMADYLEQDAEFKGKIRGAMVYPAFVSLVFFGVLYLIITFVIPSLADFLKQSGTEMPWVTKLVISISDFLKTLGWLVILALVGIGVGIYYYIKRTSMGNKLYNEVILRVPFLNSFLKKLYVTRFAMNLATLISGGIPIVQALEITAEVVGSDTYKKLILTTRDEVKKGEKMSTVFRDYPDLVPPILYQMVIVGEKTGTLDSTLVNVVDFYQREIDASVETFIRLLEPIIIIIFGVIVMGLIAAVLLPLYASMGSL